MNWRDHAVCLGMDPELFFPSGLTGPALDQAERAKAVCRRCDVTAQCLEWALENGQDGIWGETTEDEQRTLRRKRQRGRATS